MIWSPKFKPPIFSHNRFKLNVSELELMLITPKPSRFLALMDLPPLPLGRALAMCPCGYFCLQQSMCFQMHKI